MARVNTWGDGSGAKVLAVQVQVPEFKSLALTKKRLNMVKQSCHPRAGITKRITDFGEAETGGFLALNGHKS